ncbi:MAG: fluoride efflux transporter CrcB [Acidimicrobiia bacterium]|nr:fluoride efflux transporter CrcB [Acidimicrobiia bacterium]
MIWLGVAAASSLGAIARHSAMAGLERRFDRQVPWGTAVVNLIAALLLGMFVGGEPSLTGARLLGAGFLGSFSTFSTWMVEGVFIAGTGTRPQLVRAGAWVVGLIAVGVIAFGLGQSITR